MSDARLVAAAWGNYRGGPAQLRGPAKASHSKPCGRTDGNATNLLGHSSGTCRTAGTDVAAPRQITIKYPELGQAFLMNRRRVWVVQGFIPKSFVARSPNCLESVTTPSTKRTGLSIT